MSNVRRKEKKRVNAVSQQQPLASVASFLKQMNDPQTCTQPNERALASLRSLSLPRYARSSAVGAAGRQPWYRRVAVAFSSMRWGASPKGRGSAAK